MRKIIIFLPVTLILISSCREEQTFRIEGKVPNPVFYDSKVYLVALDAPVTKRVDSTMIENGVFSFEIKADTFDVRILRIPAEYPYVAQDLVVIPEAGKISVVLDSISHGGGTRLNDVLQEWKERRQFHDMAEWNLYQMMNAAETDQEKTDSLSKVMEIMNEIVMSDNICMINENLYNGIGLLIYKIYFDQLPASEKNYVTQKIGKKYLEKDAQLKARFY